MKYISILFIAISLFSCQNNTPIEVVVAKEKPKSKLVNCLDIQIQLMEAGLSEKKALIETIRIDNKCHCLDSLK